MCVTLPMRMLRHWVICKQEICQKVLNWNWERISVKELTNAVEEVCGTKIAVIHGQKQAGDPAVLVANPRKAHEVLGWQPQFSDIKVILESASVFEQKFKVKSRTGVQAKSAS